MSGETEENLFKNPVPMVVSLDLELSTLARASRGAEILTDLQLRRGLMDEEMERDAPECVLSILSLVGGRIDQLRRAVRGEENPANLLSTLNAVSLPDSPLEELDADVILLPWEFFRGAVVIAYRERAPRVVSTPLEEVRGKKAKEPKGRKGKESKGGKAKEPERGLTVVPREEPKEPQPSSSGSPSIPGEEPKEPPPAAS